MLQDEAAFDSGIDSGEEDNSSQLWAEKFKPRYCNQNIHMPIFNFD